MSKSLAWWSAVRKFFTRTSEADTVSKDTNTGYEATPSSSEPTAKENDNWVDVPMKWEHPFIKRGVFSSLQTDHLNIEE